MVESPSLAGSARNPPARLPRAVVVSAPARVHFGLLSVGENLPVNYGGAGLMLQGPRTVVEAAAADRFSVTKGDADWLGRLAARWLESFGRGGDCAAAGAGGLPPAALGVVESAPRHMGLGSGTQMAFAVGAALSRLFGSPLPGPVELAGGMDRGRRSAIGTYGFFEGGFLVDRGRARGEGLSVLDLRLDFPEEWTVVLVLPPLGPGRHGAAEQAVFGPAARSTQESRDRLTMLLRDVVVPAVAGCNYDDFAGGIREFNRLSGEYYLSSQPAGYHSESIREAIGLLQKLGCPAVAQSSWGPGMVAILPDPDRATHIADAVRSGQLPHFARAAVVLTRCDNRGASVTVH